MSRRRVLPEEEVNMRKSDWIDSDKAEQKESEEFAREREAERNHEIGRLSALDRSLYTPHRRARVKQEIRRRCGNSPILVEILTAIDLNDLGDQTMADFLDMLRKPKNKRAKAIIDGEY